ncbi:hypothetical protein HMPREF0201_02427 [Cedecea davisae DSM 4568]|uniref:Uncharacterized protein n=1 Tax=Cedecea davisae DSM 4568 TaxID=566551 RepID=S3IVS4_9ENTR|nr:hypothetical protein HMPREF0201_02427 [Cedecea davisae DSM 4568]
MIIKIMRELLLQLIKRRFPHNLSIKEKWLTNLQIVLAGI